MNVVPLGMPKTIDTKICTLAWSMTLKQPCIIWKQYQSVGLKIRDWIPREDRLPHYQDVPKLRLGRKRVKENRIEMLKGKYGDAPNRLFDLILQIFSLRLNRTHKIYDYLYFINPITKEKSRTNTTLQGMQKIHLTD